MDTPHERRRPHALDVLAFLALAALALFVGNGAARPLEEHEVFVARTATEIGRSGQFLLPTFDGAARLEKPPLGYWTALASQRLLGGASGGVVGEFAARLPSALAALALVFVTFELARLAFGDRRAGLAAAALWATSLGTFLYSHNARPEMLYALCCGLAMLGFVRLALRVGSSAANAALAWGGVLLALAAKGPFLPAFIVAGIAFACWRARRRDPSSPTVAAVLRPWFALALLLVAGAYVGFVLLRVPHALEFWTHQMFDRTGGAGKAGLAFLTLPYLWSTPPMLAPWLMLIPFAALSAWRSRALGVRMLGAAFVVALLFLSFSRRGHDYYTLPVLPFACALMGGAAVELLDRWRVAAPRRLARTLRVHALIALLLAPAAVAARLLREREVELGASTAPVVAFAVLAAFVALFALLDSARAPERSFGLTAAAFACVFAAVGVGNLDCEKELFTKAAFAKQVGAYLPPGVPIARESGSLELLVYYGDRTVDDLPEGGREAWLAAHPDGLVLARASELASGQVKGLALLTEQVAGERDPMVLVDPRR